MVGRGPGVREQHDYENMNDENEDEYGHLV
jgi:hypothetical protein